MQKGMKLNDLSYKNFSKVDGKHRIGNIKRYSNWKQLNGKNMAYFVFVYKNLE